MIIMPIYGQIEVEPSFYDNCKKNVQQFEFTIFDAKTGKVYYSSDNRVIIPTIGEYLLQSEVVNGDFGGIFSITVNVKNVTKFKDTLYVPNIRFTGKMVLHSPYWNYFNCGKLCNGQELDYYPNGNKRLSGNFQNGKPIEFTEYRIDGIKETRYWFKIGFMDYEKIEHFDKLGKLEEYEIHHNKKTKTVIRIYNAKGKFIRKEIQNHYIEKVF